MSIMFEYREAWHLTENALWPLRSKQINTIPNPNPLELFNIYFIILFKLSETFNIFSTLH